MLRFVVAALSVTKAAGSIVGYEWPGNGGTANTVIAANTAVSVTDPIGANNEVIDTSTAVATTTYVGLFTALVPTSHTEQATGGPVTKVSCAGIQSECELPLYQNNDRLNPVSAGVYYARAVNGDDLDYSSSVTLDANNYYLTVTVDPYISAWGNTTNQVDGMVIERGSNIYVTWDGLSVNDVVEYRYDTGASPTPSPNCPVDYYTITAADQTAGRGTINFKTWGATTADLVGFAIPGTHEINMVTASIATYADTSNCVLGSTSGVQRTVDIVDTDIVNVGGKSDGSQSTAEAGETLTVNYVLGSATTAGTYVGLFISGTAPNSHVVDPDGTAGAPLSAAYLPVGISGSGSIQLSSPVTTAAGLYFVMMFNENDAYFGPIADTSYTAENTYGPHYTGAIATTYTNTDVTFIAAPTGEPTGQPSGEPSGAPSPVPTSPTGQPTGIPTSSPSFVEEPWGEYVWTEKRHRKAGMCENQCSGHGTCEVNGNCKCFKGLDGEDEWTGPDCSSRTCPFDFAWVGSSINSNNLHPWAECSNKGICDRSSGECQCFTGYEGAACQRTVCPDNCNDQGTCWPEKHLASKAGRVYDAPWDAMKHVGCLCDAGYRGPACDQQECPSGADPLSGYGNEAGRDCSGRGICDYSNGICACFTGFFGTRCQHQTTVM
jgi:hypothetical protein